jgi:hypothetical protein
MPPHITPEGVNLPNVMTPGAWVILAVVLSGILAGFIYMYTRFRKDQIPWNKLAGFYAAKFFVEPGNESFDAGRLVMCLKKAEELLLANTKWTTYDTAKAFARILVYVKKGNDWVDGQGQKVAGQDPAGRVVVVGADFAALLHEMAHQVEDLVERIVDYKHDRWIVKGIRAAEAEYLEWLKTVP